MDVAGNLSRDVDQSNLATNFIQFLYLLYTCLYAAFIFKPLALAANLRPMIKLADKELTDVWKMVTSLLKRFKTKTHPKVYIFIYI